QSLCHDAKNYVESFIFDTTEELRLFAYQIIWNMLASSYKDDDSTELDDLKLKMELTAYG
ncbi:Phosphatidylinositol 4-kinase STT4, partial [Candida parapsilosis]